MKSKNQFVVSFLLKSATVFLSLLLCADISSGEVTPSTSKPNIIAQVLTNQEKEELVRLRGERDDRAQIQADFEQAFNRTTILLNIWLVILSLFPVAIIVLFWLFRRVAIREIVDRAMSQFEGVEKLENQLTIVKQDAENLIQDTKSINRLLERETESLQQKIKVEQDNLSLVTSDLLQAKTDNLAQISIEIANFQSKIESLLLEFANKLSQSELDTQQQRHITLENIGKIVAELSNQLSELQKEAEEHQNLVLENIDTSRFEFNNHLVKLQAETQQHRNNIWDNLIRLQSEFTIKISESQRDLQQQKDIKLDNIQEVRNIFNAQVSELQLETQHQKDNLWHHLNQVQLEFIEQLSKSESDLQLQKDRVLARLEEWKNLLQFQVSELPRQKQEELTKIQSEFASYLSELKIDAQKQKDSILSELMENKTAVFSERKQIQEIHLEKLADENEQTQLSFDECIQQGDSLFSQKNYEEAIAYYEQAVKIVSDDAVAWFKRGLTLARLNRFKDAIKSYNQAIKIQPDYHQAWCDLGVAFGNIRRHQEAFTAFNKATQVKEDDAIAWLNRGLALIELEEYEEAIASFDKALQFQPNSPKIWDKRGYTLVRLGLDDEAVISFDKALEIKPDYASAYYNKAACYALQREVNLALANLEHAINLNPRYKEDAATDIDFDEIANNEHFQELIAVTIRSSTNK
ncbi:tetratricopeptide repeat protein [Anabaena subtropica]|uniref:Tetratricopeptide repeat protein n=1 Tax=Anabaena subtropica FACHB-260 TaxID=2692884 RepID=A0ABR8CXL2_9NOST|nr:tetratricopeptide repeat protein [Anabaena subtropica]MBD2347099.1 tetratricopeptide repeat protein [Anabaena subtropica FACHB-260]